MNININNINVTKNDDGDITISTPLDTLLISEKQGKELCNKLHNILIERDINKAKKELVDTRNALTFEMQDIIRTVDNAYPLKDDVLKFGILVERVRDILSLLVIRYNHYWDIKDTDWEKDIK